MALVNVKERWSGINGQIEQTNIEGAQRGVAARAYTVLFDAAPAIYDVIDAAGIPDIGEQHPDANWIACRRKRAVPLGPFLYDVVCDYAGQDSPLIAPAQISWQEASSTELVDRDSDGNALVNGAGEPYQVSVPISDLVAVITRNEAAYPYATMYAYWNAVNSDVVAGTWPAGTVKMLPITAVRQDDGTTYYYVITYRMQFRSLDADGKGGWPPRVPNKGKRYRAVAGGDLLRVRDLLGIDEALLNADGTLLNGIGAEISGGDPTDWLTPGVNKSVAFAGLSITWP